MLKDSEGVWSIGKGREKVEVRRNHLKYYKRIKNAKINCGIGSPYILSKLGGIPVRKYAQETLYEVSE